MLAKQGKVLPHDVVEKTVHLCAAVFGEIEDHLKIHVVHLAEPVTEEVVRRVSGPAVNAIKRMLL